MCYRYDCSTCLSDCCGRVAYRCLADKWTVAIFMGVLFSYGNVSADGVGCEKSKASQNHSRLHHSGGLRIRIYILCFSPISWFLALIIPLYDGRHAAAIARTRFASMSFGCGIGAGERVLFREIAHGMSSRTKLTVRKNMFRQRMTFGKFMPLLIRCQNLSTRKTRRSPWSRIGRGCFWPICIQQRDEARYSTLDGKMWISRMDGFVCLRKNEHLEGKGTGYP